MHGIPTCLGTTTILTGLITFSFSTRFSGFLNQGPLLEQQLQFRASLIKLKRVKLFKKSSWLSCSSLGYYQILWAADSSSISWFILSKIWRQVGLLAQQEKEEKRKKERKEETSEKEKFTWNGLKSIHDRRPTASSDSHFYQPKLPRSSKPFYRPQLHQTLDRDNHLLYSNSSWINESNKLLMLPGRLNLFPKKSKSRKKKKKEKKRESIPYN